MPEGSFILALDQGTTSTRSVLFEISKTSHKVIAEAGFPIKQYYPETNWVEHDLEEIWNSCLKSFKEVLAKAPHINSQKISALSITNQRETLCVFNRKDGKPLHRAIVWQCKRSLNICEQLKSEA